MAAFWTIVTLGFTFGVLGVVVFALVRLFTGESSNRDGNAPTVDSGWRAFSG